MEIQLEKLAVGPTQLVNILRAFRGMKISVVQVEAKNHTLYLRGSNNERKYTESSSIDWAQVGIPYHGDKYGCFAEVGSLVKDISGHDGTKFEIRTRAMPLGWDESKLMTFKGADTKELDIEKMKRDFLYLLQANPMDVKKMDLRGLVIDKGFMASTDGVMVAMTSGHPQLVPSPRLLGVDAATGLYDLMKILKPAHLHARYSKTRTTFGYKMETEAIEAFVSSRVRHEAFDLTEFCPEITDNAIGFSVSTESLKAFLVEAIPDHHGSTLIVYLQTQDGSLSYRTMYESAGEYRDIHKGEIPMLRVAGVGDVGICLDLEKLLRMILGSEGEGTQFIIPCHPKNGFKYYSIDPIVVNCNGEQFAVIQQYALQPDKAQTLREEREASLGID